MLFLEPFARSEPEKSNPASQSKDDVQKTRTFRATDLSKMHLGADGENVYFLTWKSFLEIDFLNLEISNFSIGHNASPKFRTLWRADEKTAQKIEPCVTGVDGASKMVNPAVKNALERRRSKQDFFDLKIFLGNKCTFETLAIIVFRAEVDPSEGGAPIRSPLDRMG